MLTQKYPRFPQGTVIVKQKLAIPTAKGKSAAPVKPKPDQQPELLTVMIKREAGYDPANGDWEFMVTDGPGLQSRRKRQIGSACQFAIAPTPRLITLCARIYPRRLWRRCKTRQRQKRSGNQLIRRNSCFRR